MRISSMPTSEGMTGTRDRDDAATLGASTTGADPTINPPDNQEQHRRRTSSSTRMLAPFPPDGVEVVRPHR
jgi:hypothetical protein